MSESENTKKPELAPEGVHVPRQAFFDAGRPIKHGEPSLVAWRFPDGTIFAVDEQEVFRGESPLAAAEKTKATCLVLVMPLTTKSKMSETFRRVVNEAERWQGTKVYGRIQSFRSKDDDDVPVSDLGNTLSIKTVPVRSVIENARTRRESDPLVIERDRLIAEIYSRERSTGRSSDDAILSVRDSLENRYGGDAKTRYLIAISDERIKNIAAGKPN